MGGCEAITASGCSSCPRATTSLPSCSPASPVLAGQDTKGETSPHLGHEFCPFSDLWGTAPLAETPSSQPGPPWSSPSKSGVFVGKGCLSPCRAGEGSALAALPGAPVPRARRAARSRPGSAAVVIYCSNKVWRSSQGRRGSAFPGAAPQRAWGRGAGSQGRGSARCPLARDVTACPGRVITPVPALWPCRVGLPGADGATTRCQQTPWPPSTPRQPGSTPGCCSLPQGADAAAPCPGRSSPRAHGGVLTSLGLEPPQLSTTTVR